MKYLMLLAACALVTAALLCGCSNAEARAGIATAGEVSEKDGEKDQAARGRASAEVKTVNVRVERVSSGSLTENVIARGVTAADHEVTYSAEVAGKLGKLTVELGDRVAKGQLLARIDFRTLAAQAKQARANHDLAKTTYDRLMQLRAEDLVAQQQIDEAQSGLTASQAQLTIAESQLSKSTVRANRPGIVARKYVEEAEFVAPGTRLYDIIDYDTIVVEAQLAETQVSSVTSGAAVDVEIGGLGKSFPGTVDTLIPSADKVSKTFTLRVQVDNPELEILVGMSATVRIAARVHEGVIVVKQSSVVEGRGGRSVFVAENGVAVKRRAELGQYEDDRVIITRGLTAGDELIVVGQRDLMDRQPIIIVE